MRSTTGVKLGNHRNRVCTECWLWEKRSLAAPRNRTRVFDTEPVFSSVRCPTNWAIMPLWQPERFCINLSHAKDHFGNVVSYIDYTETGNSSKHLTKTPQSQMESILPWYHTLSWHAKWRERANCEWHQIRQTLLPVLVCLPTRMSSWAPSTLMYAILNLSFLSNIYLIVWYFAALCGFELIVSIDFCLNLSYRLIYAMLDLSYFCLNFPLIYIGLVKYLFAF